jgi:hypothetical protein
MILPIAMKWFFGRRQQKQIPPPIEMPVETLVHKLLADGSVSEKGTISGTGFRIPNIERVKFDRYPDALIASNITESYGYRNMLGLFPDPEDAYDFLMNKVKEDGFKELFPGAVSALFYFNEPEGWKVHDLQNLYKQPFLQELEERYKGGRRILLEYFFSQAYDNNVGTVCYEICPDLVYSHEAKFDNFIRIGKKFGYSHEGTFDILGFAEKAPMKKAVLSRNH